MSSQRLIRYVIPNILFLGLSLITWGCTTKDGTSSSPVISLAGGLGPADKCRALSCKEQAQVFSEQFPTEAVRYTTLSQAPSSEQLDYLVDMYVEQVKTALSIIEERLDDPEAARKALKAFSERYDWNAFFRMAAGDGGFRTRMKSGDSLYFFVYTHPTSEFRDYGYLVLRNGHIVLRDPHEWDGNPEVLEENGLPFPYIIDEL